jgi:aspartate aminotransferase-like enzyme
LAKNRLLTPGPVAVPDRVLLAMARPLIHHRAPEFLPVFEEIRAGLKRVFQTQQDVLILASSGTGAMEAAVSNVLAPGDRAVVVRGGKFGERWAELCEAYGVEPICVDVEWGRAVDPAAVRDAFRRAPDARALLVQVSETSTGVYHPIRELAALVRESEERLLILDAITGVGVHDLPMDAWGIDVVVGGSQKAFMLPPGLAFIALSERAKAVLGRGARSRFYFDLRAELEVQPDNQTAWTAPVSLLQGLQEALKIMLEKGLPALFEKHRTLALVTRAGMRGIGLSLYAPDSPSHAVTAVCVPDSLDGKALVKCLRDRYAITAAGGQGKVANTIFRIGHMGDLDAFDMITAVAAVELALADLGYPVKVGEGTRAALECLRDCEGR